MRIDELEAVLAQLDAEGRRPKFVYSVPTFQNPAGVTMSLRAPAAAGRARPLARDAGRRGQPLRPAALRRRAAAAALPARRRRLRHLHRHLLEDPLPRDPARLGGGAAAGDGEDRARQAGRRPLHLDPDPVLRARVLRRRPLARVRREPRPGSTGAGATRWSRRWPSSSRAGRPGPNRKAASSSGRPCPSSSTPATCWRGRCATTSPSSPARRPTSTSRGRNSMRLNFSGVGEDEIREGVRRIGKVIAEQVELYGTPDRASSPGSTRHARRAAEDGGRARRTADSTTSCRSARAAEGERVKVAVLKGGKSLERNVSLRSGARVEDALARLGHEVGAARRRRRPGRAAARRGARRRLRRPARPRRRGRHRAGAARDPRHPLHRPRRRRLRALHRQGARQARDARRPGSRRPPGSPSTRPRFRELGAGDALGELEQRLGFPLVVKPSRGGSALGVKFAADAGRGAGGAGRRLQLRRPRPARALRRRPRARGQRRSATRRCRSSRRSPSGGDRYDFEARYEIGRTRFECPAELADGRADGGRSRRRSAPTGRSAARASRGST